MLRIWDQIQRLQTDFANAQRLSFYYTSPQWHEARTVLDIAGSAVMATDSVAINSV